MALANFWFIFFYWKFPLESENSTKGSQIKQVLELKPSKIDNKISELFWDWYSSFLL